MENIVEKRRNCTLGAISPLFHNTCILLPVVRFPCENREKIFTSREVVIRDKQSRDNDGRLLFINTSILITKNDSGRLFYLNLSRHQVPTKGCIKSQNCIKRLEFAQIQGRLFTAAHASPDADTLFPGSPGSVHSVKI